MSKIYRVLFASFLLLLSTQTIFAGRYYDSAIGRWLSVDPKANKYPGWSPYNYALNNPLIYTDPNGDTVVVNNIGYIIRNDKTDNLVYMQNGKSFTQIGELGGTIDINIPFSNLLNKDLKEAVSITNPKYFEQLVKTGGNWDFKGDS